jgi:ribosome biogenesis GTPase A
MAEPDGELTVAQRLGRALDRGLLPAGGPAEAAERLIERLERSARVALLGLPGSGKSSILNLLVGAVVVPETLRLPTIIVQHGDVARMICTLTDGTTKLLPGHDLPRSCRWRPRW